MPVQQSPTKRSEGRGSSLDRPLSGEPDVYIPGTKAVSMKEIELESSDQEAGLRLSQLFPMAEKPRRSDSKKIMNTLSFGLMGNEQDASAAFLR